MGAGDGAGARTGTGTGAGTSYGRERVRGDWELELTCRRGAVFACGFLLCSVNFVRCWISSTVWIVLLLLVCGLIYGSFV